MTGWRRRVALAIAFASLGAACSGDGTSAPAAVGAVETAPPTVPPTTPPSQRGADIGPLGDSLLYEAAGFVDAQLTG